MASTAVRSKVVVYFFDDSLFIVAPIVCGLFVLRPSLFMQYLVSFLVLQSSR